MYTDEHLICNDSESLKSYACIYTIVYTCVQHMQLLLGMRLLCRNNFGWKKKELTVKSLIQPSLFTIKAVV